MSRLTYGNETRKGKKGDTPAEKLQREMSPEEGQVTLEQRIMKRHKSLENEYHQGWLDHHRDLADHILPRRGRWLVSNRKDRKSQGKRLHHKIYNSTATVAHRTLCAGLMAGLTSPARPWFRVGAGDRRRVVDASARKWMHNTTETILGMMAQGNFYNSIHALYEELTLFGTDPLLMLEHPKKYINCQTLTSGEYYVAANAEGANDVLYRHYPMTVHQLIHQFGYEAVGESVREDVANNRWEVTYEVIHAIEPRANGLPGSPFGLKMPWASVWVLMGKGSSGSKGRATVLLRESGYNEQPFAAPRWSILGGDSYGRSPSMDALPDVRQLQFMELKKARGIDRQVDPPLMAHASAEHKPLSTLPGKVSYFSVPDLNNAVRSLYDVNVRVDHLTMDIEKVEARIDEAYYKELFTSLLYSDRREMTAREVQERHEEKLVMLGPVLERLHTELLDPVIKRYFGVAWRAGLIEPPPEAVRANNDGVEVEYISILAQAQRAVGTGAMQDFVTFIGGLSEMAPEVTRKPNWMELVDDYAYMTGQNPKIVRPTGEVKAEVDREKQQAQAMAMAEQAPNMKAGAEAASELASIPDGGENLLQRIMGGGMRGPMVP